MATEILNTQQLYDIGKNEIQNQNADLTDFNDGSLLDILTGVMATMVGESQRITIDGFAKTFIETANGPEVTGGDDDLQRLLVDHFGDDFARPQAVQSQGVVSFSRATTGGGTVDIPLGTIVKTAPDSSGTVQRFQTIEDVSLSGLTINAPIQAVLAGSSGNVQPTTVVVIESTLTDQTIVVSNSAVISGGSDEDDDSTYREFARNLLTSLRGATMQAIEAKALTVPGVVQAVGTEVVQTVIGYNPATSTTSGAAFQVSKPTLYIADANGSASSALIVSVAQAIESVRAAGVIVIIIPATAVTLNVTASFVLNASGPNYASLSTSIAPILQTLTNYIQTLPIGTGFVRATAIAAVAAVWGASGSNDLTSMSFVTPSADTSVAATQTLIPGTIASV